MKTWIITENDMRYFIKNCDEILSGEDYSYDLGTPSRCIIREKDMDNPFYQALYMAVSELGTKNAKQFVIAFRNMLNCFVEHKTKTANALDIIDKIMAKAIEIDEQPCQ